MRAENVVESTRSEKGTFMPGHWKNERRRVPDGDRIQGLARHLASESLSGERHQGHPPLGRQSELQSRSVHRRPIRADAGLESSEYSRKYRHHGRRNFHATMT